MTLRTATLTTTETELVAIGASIGAGCHPCLEYHLQEGEKAGLGRAVLLQAVADGECVKRSAYNELAVRSRELLGEAADLPPSCCDDTSATKEFVSVGSAVGANSVAQLRKHIEQARTVGIDEAQLIQAIEIAGNVQRHAAAATAREAEALTGVPAQGHSPVFLSAQPSQVPQEACGSDCACNAEAETVKSAHDNGEAKQADSEITGATPGKCC
jgi:AhpD family alkylhydroperoxidase